MRLFFFLMRHMILILFGLYVAAGYVYRHDIFALDAAVAVPAQAAPQRQQKPATQSAAAEPAPTVKPQKSPEQERPPVAAAPAAYHFRPDHLGQPGVDGDSLDRLLQQGRELAKRGETLAAEQRYWQLIERFPQSPAAYGELGNLYLASEQPDKAAEAYLQAGMRIQEGLESVRIKDLLQALEQLSPEKALLLRQHAGKIAP
jgi:TolA-binding protein